MASSDADKLIAKADKLTKLTLTRWSADWRSATALYEQAANSYRVSKKYEKGKEAFEKASKGQEMQSSPWDAAKHMESAAALAKELKNWTEVAEFYKRAAELYTECGRGQPASDALAKAARCASASQTSKSQGTRVPRERVPRTATPKETRVPRVVSSQDSNPSHLPKPSETGQPPGGGTRRSHHRRRPETPLPTEILHGKPRKSKSIKVNLSDSDRHPGGATTGGGRKHHLQSLLIHGKPRIQIQSKAQTRIHHFEQPELQNIIQTQTSKLKFIQNFHEKSSKNWTKQNLDDALEDAVPDKAIELYTEACAILEEEGKEQMTFDLYRATTSVYLKLEKYTDAAACLLSLALAADKSNATHSQSKAYLSAIVVYLYAHDFAQAEKCHNDCCQIEAFLSSDQNRCANKLLSAYREGDVEEIKRVANSSIISNLDHMIIKLARKLPTGDVKDMKTDGDKEEEALDEDDLT